MSELDQKEPSVEEQKQEPIQNQQSEEIKCDAQEQIQPELEQNSKNMIPQDEKNIGVQEIKLQQVTNEKEFKENRKNQQRFQDEKQQKLQEKQIIQQACFERKNEGYKYLKDWDLSRAVFLQFHRNLVEKIQGIIDQRVKIQQDFFKIVMNYIIQRKQQEELYIQSHIQNLAKIFTDSHAKNIIDPELIDSLVGLEKINQEQISKRSEFCLNIQSQVLDQMQSHMQIFDLQVNNIRNELINLKMQLKSINIETSRQSGAFAKAFMNMNQGNNDLFRQQNHFLLLAKDQMIIQKQLAYKTLQFLNIVRNSEHTQLQVYQECLQKFVELLVNVYGKCSDTDQIANYLQQLTQKIQSFEIFDENLQQQKDHINVSLNQVEEAHKEYLKQSQESKQFYQQESIFHLDFAKLISQQEFAMIKQIIQENNQNINEQNLVYQFLYNFDIIIPDSHSLVIKEMNAQRRSDDDNGFIPCKLFLTVDGYLQSYDIPEQNASQTFYEPTIEIHLRSCSVTLLEDQIVEIGVVKHGFILNSINKFFYLFKNMDVIEEFFESVKRARQYTGNVYIEQEQSNSENDD